MSFSSIKTPRFHQIGARPHFLGPLGYPAMEKSNKTYKNSGPPKEGLQGTMYYSILDMQCNGPLSSNPVIVAMMNILSTTLNAFQE